MRVQHQEKAIRAIQKEDQLKVEPDLSEGYLSAVKV